MYKAYIAENFIADGVNISLVARRSDGVRSILRTSDGEVVHWEEVPDPATNTKPTLVLNHEAARALLDALLHHYEGASDMHTQREDFKYERARVDKLMDALATIASRK
jgi:hypothetical protein